MATYQFDAVLIRPEGVGTWTYLDIPFDVKEAFGAKGQVKVKGTVNEYPFRSSAMPHGDGRHYLVVNKEIRTAIGAAQGDTVHVTLEADSGERILQIPPDLAQTLEAHPDARAVFDRLSYSHQKEYVDWIEGAKQAATRQGRIEKAIPMLTSGKTPKSRLSPSNEG